MPIRAFRCAPAALLVILAGCAGQIRERHHFATIHPDTGEVANIFRVDLAGAARIASARYVAGFYDERAVDLFFNEAKAVDFDSANVGRGVAPIFGVLKCEGLSGDARKACEAAAQERLRLVPVGADLGQEGAFVMILSTDVDAITNTIGAFAKNREVLDAVVGLATRSERQAAATLTATAETRRVVRAAQVAEIDSLAKAAADTGTSESFLAVLRAVGGALAPGAAPAFQSIGEARAWFAALPRPGGQ